MQKANAIRYYRKFSGADKYILGFVYKHDLYMITVDEIMPRYMKVEKASSKNGGGLKLQMSLKNKHKEQLIRKGAELIGTEEQLLAKVSEIETRENKRSGKGWALEELICERYGIETKPQDTKGFWLGGDIRLNDVEYQIKFENAQVVAFSTLKNLQKRA